MATEEIKFVENHREYNDIYQVFACREQEKVWIDNDLVPKLLKVFKLDKSVAKSEFNVLAVGSGVGAFDCLLIKSLLTHGKGVINGKQITWTVVEPNALAIDEFKKKVSSDADICASVSFSWINKGVDEFLEVTEPGKYDLIHFIHVLYYVQEDMVLKKSYEKLLGDPGCIVVAVGSEGDIWGHIVNSFKAKVPSMDFTQPTNMQLSEIGKRNGWPYDVFDGKVNLEITEIFNQNDPKGEAILKFFFHINGNPREQFGKELMLEIMDFFRKMSWEKAKDGKTSFYIKLDAGVLLFYKGT